MVTDKKSWSSWQRQRIDSAFRRASVTAMGFALISVHLAVAIEITTVLEGLNNPSGVAVQPRTDQLYVAETSAARVIRVTEGKSEPVITEFPTETREADPRFAVGPLGLLFLDQKRLIVGGGGLPGGQNLLRVFTVPPAGKSAVLASQAASQFSLEPSASSPSEFDFFALAATRDSVYVTCQGAGQNGCVSQLRIDKDRQPVALERLVEAGESSGLSRPGGIAVSPKGGHIVVAQMGLPTLATDSLLTFYDQQGGLVLRLETELRDVTSLAYNSSGQLFATDLAWSKPAEGGLFKLVGLLQDGIQRVVAKKVTTLDRPTAMAFDSQGALYVTVLGSDPDAAEKPSGKLLKVTW